MSEAWHPENLCEGIRKNSSGYGPTMVRKNKAL